MKKIIAFLIFLFGLACFQLYLNSPSQKLESIHFAEREMPIQFLVVHSFSSSMPDFVDKLNKLEVSTHYIIDKEGHIFNLVPDDKVAWHAGKSFWRGSSSLNALSIGIELQNDTLGQSPFPTVQIDSFVKLATQIINKYTIPFENVVAHSDIAPTRKVDVGKEFPWKQVAKDGVGLWLNENVAVPAKEEDVSKLLSQIGYDITDVKAAAYAFMRRFVPELVADDNQIDQLEENLPSWIQQVDLANPLFLLKLNQAAAVYPKYAK